MNNKAYCINGLCYLLHTPWMTDPKLSHINKIQKHQEENYYIPNPNLLKLQQCDRFNGLVVFYEGEES